MPSDLVGNVLMQAASLGAVPAELAGMRTLVRATQPLLRFTPAGDERGWRSGAVRQREIGKFAGTARTPAGLPPDAAKQAAAIPGERS